MEFIYPIVSGMEVGILVYSRAYIIEWANDFAKALFPNLDLNGNPCYDQFYQRPTPCEHCIVEKTFQTGNPHERESIFPGTNRWYLEKVYPITNDSGEITHVYEIFQEITAYKDFQKVLTESERRYREMIDLLPQVFFESNLQGRILESNRFAREKFAYTQRDIARGLYLSDFLKSEDMDRALLQMKRLYLSPQEYIPGSVYRFIDKKGNDFYGAIYNSLFYRDDKPAGYRGIIIDVTERSLMEKALRESEVKYRSVVENSNDGILLIQNEQFQYANKAILKMFGFEKEEDLIGKEIYERIAPEYRESMKGTHRKRLSGHSVPARYEAAILDIQNHPIPVEISVNMIHINETPTALTFVRDLREQKEAERKRRESADDFQMVISEINDVFWKVDISPEGEVVDYFISPAFETVFNIKIKSARANFIAIIARIHRDDRRDFLHWINRILKGLVASFYYEYRITRKYGTYSWFYNRGKVQRLGNGNIRAFGITSDFDERKQMEIALKEAKEKAEEATRTKGQFLANMSHEIRTPLNSIIGMSDLSLTTDDPAEMKGYLHTIRESTRHLLGVINQILDFSKIDSGKVLIDAVDFNLPALLEATLENIRTNARKKNIEIKVELSSDLPEAVHSDPVKIRQILTNILDNAVKFTSEGYVSLTASWEKSGDDEGGTLHFSVEDTGPGIRRDNLSAIFESFRQEEKSTYRTYGGTGLGLTITKSYIELLGGFIGVESEYGKGTKFIFSIPVSMAQTNGDWKEIHIPEAIRKLTTSGKAATVLLAEDNEDNIALGQVVLKKCGHAFDVARNGMEVLEKLTQKRYDLILMDVEMPVMNGILATRRIRSGKCGINSPDIPILAMTAHVIPEIREKCENAGMNGYIEKPISIFTLDREIQRYL